MAGCLVSCMLGLPNLLSGPIVVDIVQKENENGKE